MSNYTFTFKKGDITAEFFTTDKLVIERQFPIWVASASAVAKNKPSTAEQSEEKKSPNPKTVIADTPVAEEVKEQSIVVPEVVSEESFEQEQVLQPEIEEQQVEATILHEEDVVPEVSEANPAEEVQVFDKAADLLKTINTIQNPVEEQQVEAEAVIDFDKVLEESIENPTFEPNQARDERFLDVVAAKRTADRFHYLIITAYYLLEYEKMERFSLKQINAKLMNNISRVVDHTILREAINQEFIEVVHDLTGSSEAAEYRLTEKGEEFFKHGIY